MSLMSLNPSLIYSQRFRIQFYRENLENLTQPKCMTAILDFFQKGVVQYL